MEGEPSGGVGPTPSESNTEKMNDSLPWETGERKRKSKRKERLWQFTLEAQGQETDEDLHTYEQLLKRIRDMVRERNVQLGRPVDEGLVKFQCPLPGVIRHAPKTSFINFVDVCQHLKRQPKHLLQFFRAETGTCCSISASDQLILRGIFKSKHIEQILRSYIKEYVLCHACHQSDTFLLREGRMVYLCCNTCEAKASVAPMTHGFVVRTRMNVPSRRSSAC